jgi:hypothetical protein
MFARLRYSIRKISVSPNYFWSRIPTRTPPHLRVTESLHCHHWYWLIETTLTALLQNWQLCIPYFDMNFLECLLVLAKNIDAFWQLQRKSLTKCKRVKIKRKKIPFFELRVIKKLMTKLWILKYGLQFTLKRSCSAQLSGQIKIGWTFWKTSMQIN